MASMQNDKHSRRRVALALLLTLVTAAGISACSDQKMSYTGIWKSNCSDYWGVQIKPADGGLYSVTFCGLSGCVAPGAWAPNTRLSGDPMYEVVSATKIRIKRNDAGSFTYLKCGDDPFWPTKPGY